MSLLGFLTGIGSLFGGEDDKNAQQDVNKASSTTGTTNRGVVGSETSTGTTAATTRGTTDTSKNAFQKTNTSDVTRATGTSDTLARESGVTTGSTVGTTKGSTTGTTTGTQAQTQAQSQAQKTSMFSGDILASLDAVLKSSLTSGDLETGSDAIKGRLSQVQALAAEPDFDVGNYVSGIAAAAGAATQSDLDSRINTILSATGTSETGNSMSSLLGNKLRNEAAANLAGITANATATGEQIRQQQQRSYTDQIAGLAGGLGEQITSLLGVSSGAQQSTTGTGQTVSTGTSATQEAQAQTQQQIQNQRNTSDVTSHTAGTTSQTQAQTTASSTAAGEHQVTRESQIAAVNENKKSNTAGAIIETQKSNTNEVGAVTGSETTGNIFTNILKALGKSALAA